MRYTLKDARLLGMMREIYRNFDAALAIACDSQFYDETDFVTVDHLYKHDGLMGSIQFYKSEIEKNTSFSPYYWNPYPLVEPWRGVKMRVETESGYCTCAMYTRDGWKDDAGNTEDDFGNVVRFRPWDD